MGPGLVSRGGAGRCGGLGGAAAPASWHGMIVCSVRSSGACQRLRPGPPPPTAFTGAASGVSFSVASRRPTRAADVTLSLPPLIHPQEKAAPHVGNFTARVSQELATKPASVAAPGAATPSAASDSIAAAGSAPSPSSSAAAAPLLAAAAASAEAAAKLLGDEGVLKVVFAVRSKSHVDVGRVLLNEDELIARCVHWALSADVAVPSCAVVLYTPSVCAYTCCSCPLRDSNWGFGRRGQGACRLLRSGH